MATEKRKIHRVIDAEGTLVQVLPETSAEQVTLADTAGNFASNNVEGALAEVMNVAKTGGVTGVKGDAESTYRKGNVNITPANLGITVVNNTADKDKRVAYATEAGKATNDSAGNNITNTYATKNELRDGLAGRAATKTYENYQAFVTAVNAMNNTALKVGDNVYIKKLDVPDMWVTAVNATSASYTYTNDQAIINALDTTNGLTVGYFSFSKLETEKVDLSTYQTKTDNNLATANKTVVGAINEVRTIAKDAKSQSDTNANAISNIVNNGVSKADTANVANKTKQSLRFYTETDSPSPYDAIFDGSVDAKVYAGYGIEIQTGGAGTNIVYIRISDNFEVETPRIVNGAVTDDKLATVPGLTGVNTTAQYSAVKVNTKGRVTAVGYSHEFGTSGQKTPSENLMLNGIFWELQ